MAHPVTVPRLGWSMEEGTFVRWLVENGQPVQRGQPLFELESDKAVEAVEALDSGLLSITSASPPEGAVVKVGERLAWIVAPGEEPPADTPHPAPRVPAALAQPGGRSESASISTRSSSSPMDAAPRVTPRARRAAKELGVDLAGLVGTGRGGRIREADVRGASHANAPLPAGRLVPLSPHRRSIARRMSAGVHEAAPVTLSVKADATRLVEFRQALERRGEAGEAVPSYTDILVKWVGGLLVNHKAINALWQPGGILECDEVNVAIAVDTESGLVAPVIHNVPGLTLEALSAESKRLIQIAGAGRLAAADLAGGTFTVSNLGMHAVDTFTPILNLPQAAILGVGRIALEPCVRGGRLCLAHTVGLSLTFDHRMVDGAPAARFLSEVVRVIGQIAP
jgi:pyruvate dehydrogenase E2 component (dihydrolipoamide acetyltransferase)